MWILLLCASLWASDAVVSTIDQAQALVVKKKRTEAVKLLNSAIDKTVPPLKGRARLIEAENNLAAVFLTDKGQKAYESGQSVFFENPELAMSQLRDAAEMEDNNILIQDGLTKLQIAKQDCASAVQTIQKTRALYPYAAEPAALELRALICQKDFDQFREKLKSLPALEKTQEQMVQYLTAQDLIRQKMWRKASELLIKITEQEPGFPEAYYWLARAGKELDRDVTNWSQKYISLCKALGPREKKRFSLEPRLCANAKDVEDEMAKKTPDN